MQGLLFQSDYAKDYPCENDHYFDFSIESFFRSVFISCRNGIAYHRLLSNIMSIEGNLKTLCSILIQSC